MFLKLGPENFYQGSAYLGALFRFEDNEAKTRRMTGMAREDTRKNTRRPHTNDTVGW